MNQPLNVVNHAFCVFDNVHSVVNHISRVEIRTFCDRSGSRNSNCRPLYLMLWILYFVVWIMDLMLRVTYLILWFTFLKLWFKHLVLWTTHLMLWITHLVWIPGFQQPSCAFRQKVELKDWCIYSILGCVLPLQEVALRQSPPSFSVLCYPCPYRSLLPHNVISPTTFWSSDWPYTLWLMCRQALALDLKLYPTFSSLESPSLLYFFVVCF